MPIVGQFSKPALEDVYLEHYGVKGMKWGVRKKRPDEEQRKRMFGPKAKKIAVTTAVIVGAVAVGYALQGRGGVSVSSVGGLTDPKSALYDTMTAGKKAATATLKKPVNLSDFPSPDVMMAQARMAGVRNEVFKKVNQDLTDATWRASANLSAQARKMGPQANVPSLDEIRQKLADPNYVWNL